MKDDPLYQQICRYAFIHLVPIHLTNPKFASLHRARVLRIDDIVILYESLSRTPIVFEVILDAGLYKNTEWEPVKNYLISNRNSLLVHSNADVRAIAKLVADSYVA